MVRAARFPLTIDPIMSTVDVDTFAANLEEPAVTYDPATERFVVVYEESFSAADTDVYMTEVSLDGSVVSGVGYVDMTGDRWAVPEIACARQGDRMLVAAIRDQGTGPSHVVGRTYTPSSRALGSVIEIDGLAMSRDRVSVSVGADELDRFLVVFEREWDFADHDVFARIVFADGSLAPLPFIALDNGVLNYQHVRCSSSCGDGTFAPPAWGLVAERGVGPDRDIWTAEIGRDGSLISPFMAFVTAPNDDASPHISAPLEQAGPRAYGVVWTRSFGTDVDAMAAIMTGSSAIGLTNLSLGGLGGPSAFDDEFIKAIETDGTSFTLVWEDRSVALASTSYASNAHFVGSGVCVASNDVLELGPLLGEPDVASNPVGLPQMFVARAVPSSVPGSLDIEGTRLSSRSTCQGQVFCGGFPNSTGLRARAHVTGSGVAGAPLRLHATRLPLGQFGMFICARNGGISPNPAGSQGDLCLTGDIGRFSQQLRNSGTLGAIWIDIDTGALPLNPVAGVVAGETMYFQAWYRDANPGPTSNFTSSVRVVFD